MRGSWEPISIDKALGLHPERVKRCSECHGQVRAHKLGTTDQRAHFEHFRAHEGCSRSVEYAGTLSRHPKAIS